MDYLAGLQAKPMNDSEPLTLHYSAPEATALPLVLCTSHGLHIIPGPVASNHGAQTRWRRKGQ
jgi:hypothetical protein